MHVRKERKLRRAQYVSGEVASLWGRSRQCAAALADRIPVKGRRVNGYRWLHKREEFKLR